MADQRCTSSFDSCHAPLLMGLGKELHIFPVQVDLRRSLLSTLTAINRHFDKAHIGKRLAMSWIPWSQVISHYIFGIFWVHAGALAFRFRSSRRGGVPVFMSIFYGETPYTLRQLAASFPISHLPTVNIKITSMSTIAILDFFLDQSSPKIST